MRLPRRGIQPLDVLGRDGSSLERLGQLHQLWTSKKPQPEIGASQPAAHVNEQQTSEMSLSIGLRMLSGVLGAIGANAPDLASAHRQAETIQFTFGNVSTRSVAPLAVGDCLVKGDLQDGNPVGVRCFDDDDTKAYVITEVVESSQVTVMAKNEQSRQVAIDVPAIKGVVGASVKADAKNSSSRELTFPGVEPATFGFKVLSIAFNGRWRIRGTAASEGMASSPETNPVLLRRTDTVVLRS